MKARFWADVWTVLRKEWLEWVSTPGWLVQPTFIVAIFGALVPVIAGSTSLKYPVVVWLWAWIPLAQSAGLVADTFAGERERDTLEALLASRLPDRAIVFGKTAAAASYGWFVTLLCWIIGWFAMWFGPGSSDLSSDLTLLISLSLLSFLAAWYVASVGVLISLRAQSARQAQQLMSMAMLGSLILSSLLAARWLLPNANGATGSLIVVAAVVLAIIDLGLLLVLLARPRRREWLIH